MLNLLPLEVKQQRRVKSQLYSVTLIYILVLVALTLGAIGLTTWGFIQQTEIDSKQERIAQLTSQRQTKNDVINKAAFIEDRLNSASQFTETRHWEDILNEVASSTPTDMTLAAITVALSPETGQTSVTLGGATSDRRSIVLFRDKIESSEHFTNSTIQSLSESAGEGGKLFTFTLGSTYTDTPKENQ